MGRNAAELRAAAIATGWFDGPMLNYVGDGYTIPWQTGLPVSPWTGGLLYVWKNELDRIALEPSRLHDWLYTPYGVDLIDATQEEADKALKEEMLAAGVAAIDTEVVYQACRIGGGPWFGRSSQGYVQPPLPGGGSNIGSLPGFAGGVMATYKVMMIFQQTSIAGASDPSIGYASAPRTGGWSESHSIIAPGPEAVRTMMIGPRTGPGAILEKRAACLSTQATVLGYRLYEVGGGRGTFVPRAFTGSVITGGDVPSMSLLCASVATGTPAVRRFSMRGIPDGQVVGGEFSPSPTFVPLLRAYFESLYGTSFRARQVVVKNEIGTIDATGKVTTIEDHGRAAGTWITVTKTLGPRGRTVSGRFFITAIGPTNKELTLRGWDEGATEHGTLSVPMSSYFPIDINGTSAVRIGNHKIGRPFAGYVGHS